MSEKRDSDLKYTESDLRWAKLYAFVSGFVSACGAVTFIITMIAEIQGMLK
jgi:hypothetical protein